MNEHIERELLSALLDKYERSRSFRDGTPPTRRILLKLYDNGQREFPPYDIEQSERRALINRAVAALAERELLAFDWMKGEEGHIIARVWLRHEHLPQAYAYAARRPKGDQMDAILLEVHKALDSARAEWARSFLKDAADTLSIKRSLNGKLPESAPERSSLLRAIECLDANGGSEMLERVFSMHCFGDSKQFEHTVRSRLLRILRRYLNSEEDATDEELLRQIGLVKYPEQFEFCGEAALVLEEGAWVDFSPLTCGSCVCLPDLARGKLVLHSGVESILSIENKANYVDYIARHREGGSFVIYHGGPFSAAKRAFFGAVVQAAAGRPWYYWGDIDYGGFSMLARLRREICPDILPFRMNKQELLRYERFTARIASDYAEKLRSLRTWPELADCVACIDYMIQERLKLEQEAMLTETP